MSGAPRNSKVGPPLANRGPSSTSGLARRSDGPDRQICSPWRSPPPDPTLGGRARQRRAALGLRPRSVRRRRRPGPQVTSQLTGRAQRRLAGPTQPSLTAIAPARDRVPVSDCCDVGWISHHRSGASSDHRSHRLDRRGRPWTVSMEMRSSSGTPLFWPQIRQRRSHSHALVPVVVLNTSTHDNWRASREDEMPAAAASRPGRGGSGYQATQLTAAYDEVPRAARLGGLARGSGFWSPRLSTSVSFS
jgi:hypothetical protein